MRLLTLSAALVLLAAGPALAGDRGGGHGGGGHPPRPPSPCCGHGGGSTNVNVNVNASARAYANASAGSYINARTYDMGGFRGGGGGSYGAVYVGGGYGGDGGGYIGTPVYYDIDSRVLACASAPFGYPVGGFGREVRGVSRCAGSGRDHGYDDRGGRYGYSERHDSYEERSYESYESYETYEEYGAHEEYEVRERDDRRGHGSDVGDYDRGYMDGRRDCDCRPDGRDGTPYPPPYLPEPPRYEPPAPPPARPHRPHRPRHDAPPRQEYRQEPGERG